MMDHVIDHIKRQAGPVKRVSRAARKPFKNASVSARSLSPKTQRRIQLPA
jgi:hypothetical protein